MTDLLLVEDEEALSEPLAFLLEQEGYSVRVAGTGAEALEVWRREGADLILLDLMLPQMSGTEVCRRVRETSTVPIVMLTAKTSEADIVMGLELGADDYVTKPYKTRELLARVRAALRRGGGSADAEHESVLEGAGVRMDLDRHSVTVRGRDVEMPLREFEVLEYLMRNSGRVLTRGQLIDRVWGSDYVGDTKTLDVHIKRIRSRIETDPSAPDIVRTVRGLGYRFDDD